MSKQYTIEEAAMYLGLTSQTLRNWDKSGKINCIREPGSNYRLFSEDELDSIKSSVKPKVVRPQNNESQKELYMLESNADLKRLISKLHRIVRDLDGRSSIIERFDELTKLLLLYIRSNGTLNPILQDVNTFSEKVKSSYTEFLSELTFKTPAPFESIKLNNQCIHSVFEYLSKFDISCISGDLKGLIYEEMIQDIFEKGDNQQFFTPKTVVEFMSEVIASLASGYICDPASGTGGFLINLAKNSHVFEKYTALEIDERLAWVSGINLELHGCKHYESLCLPNGGSLGTDIDGFRGTFDAIITNPPFGSDYSEQEGLKRLRLGAGKSSRRRGVLFIERCLEFLKEGGYLAIIIDDGVLSHSSNEDVRNLILENSELLAVVSLPVTAFMPYASVEASIFVLRKTNRPDKSNRTFYALAENIGKKNNGDEDYIYDSNGSERLNNDLDTILAQWDNHLNGDRIHNSDKCYVSNIFDSFSTSENHYSRIDFAFHHYSREIVRVAIKEHGNKLIRLIDVCQEVNEPLVPAKELPEQTIPYTGLANIESNSEAYSQVRTPANSIKSAVKKYKKGDVLFSKMRPNLKKCVTSNHDEDGYCSSECVVFRPDTEIVSGRMLSAILRSDFVFGQIVHLITGIGRPRISIKDLRTIMIPDPINGKGTTSLKNYAQSMKKVHTLKKKSHELFKQSIDLQNDTTNKIIDELLS
ncbi:MAG: N-6 DNA methylase [candidate division Zixibacteria bacterium]|nr:N-6 DNA methylase [candidate division Zixibacteria bacterium]